MVCTGHPAGIFSVHAGLADEHVIQGVVEHMAHMEYTGNVRRRNHYRIRFPAVGLGMEKPVFQPPVIPFVLYFRGIVLCTDFHILLDPGGLFRRILQI